MYDKTMRGLNAKTSGPVSTSTTVLTARRNEIRRFFSILQEGAETTSIHDKSAAIWRISNA
jgi:hypothetical protein